MNKFILVSCMILVLSCSSSANKDVSVTEYMTSSGNIQNGGYVIKFNNYYFYVNAKEVKQFDDCVVRMNYEKKAVENVR